jgi:hypothetical protein
MEHSGNRDLDFLITEALIKLQASRRKNCAEHSIDQMWREAKSFRSESLGDDHISYEA